MGYREYAKDYQINYEQIPGKKRLKSIRIYKGPWFRFKASEEQIRKVRWFYTLGIAALAVLLLIPMGIDCAFTRTWFIQVPAACAWIPWIFAVASLWRIWRAGEQVIREHRDLIHDRMSTACLFLMGFCTISALGCVRMVSIQTTTVRDYLVFGCCAASAVCGIALFSRRGDLEMVPVEKQAD